MLAAGQGYQAAGYALVAPPLEHGSGFWRQWSALPLGHPCGSLRCARARVGSAIEFRTPHTGKFESLLQVNCAMLQVSFRLRLVAAFRLIRLPYGTDAANWNETLEILHSTSIQYGQVGLRFLPQAVERIEFAFG